MKGRGGGEGGASILNILWRRPWAPEDPWYVVYGMLVTTAGVLLLCGIYMALARPYEHGQAPAGDAHRLGVRAAGAVVAPVDA